MSDPQFDSEIGFDLRSEQCQRQIDTTDESLDHSLPPFSGAERGLNCRTCRTRTTKARSAARRNRTVEVLSGSARAEDQTCGQGQWPGDRGVVRLRDEAGLVTGPEPAGAKPSPPASPAATRIDGMDRMLVLAFRRGQMNLTCSPKRHAGGGSLLRPPENNAGPMPDQIQDLADPADPARSLRVL